MTTARLTLLQRFRRWRLNRWADQLTSEAFYHDRQAVMHYEMANRFLRKAHDVRDLARRVKAAGSVT